MRRGKRRVGDKQKRLRKQRWIGGGGARQSF